ncbi:MAG: NAD(P)H-dependent oxidoreductase [Spirochaetes bacterium]|jgi:multimeric flavodoxin WrbA|nr:NAD(P)H-dependent oxidoreductase [Spirochaetota bacterium]
MKVTILNGSPKGDLSVTLQYAEFIKKKFPQNRYTTFNIAQKIKKIEAEPAEFKKIMTSVKESDAVIWAFPLYYMLVHGSYKRFIELIFERKAGVAFKNKHTITLSTSIKFFDNTAHDYMHAICDDLQMQYVGYFSASMSDLKKNEKQKQLTLFAKSFFKAVNNNEQFSQSYSPINYKQIKYNPAKPKPVIDNSLYKIIILSAGIKPKSNLENLINYFCGQFTKDIERIDLSKEDIKTGCLGCCHCGYDNTCIMENKDGYVNLFKSRIQSADIIIVADQIHDRYLSSKWKTFLDRSFFNTHKPSLLNKQIGFLISGPYSQTGGTLQTTLQGWCEFQKAGNIGVVTDEQNSSKTTDNLIRDFAARASWGLQNQYITTDTFLRVGGFKIFRDEVYCALQIIFQADHTYYKKNGYYDFP